MSLPQCVLPRAIAIILLLLTAGELPLYSRVSAKAAEVSSRLKVGLRIVVSRPATVRRHVPAPPLPRPRPAGLAKH